MTNSSRDQDTAPRFRVSRSRYLYLFSVVAALGIVFALGGWSTELALAGLLLLILLYMVRDLFDKG